MAVDLSCAKFEVKRWDNHSTFVKISDIKIDLINEEKSITFHRNNVQIDDCKEIMDVLQNSNSRIYLEFVSKYTGQYLYYNLMELLTETQSSNIDTNMLSRKQLRSIDVTELELTENDVLILSAIRDLYSLESDFSFIGEFNGGKLFLGKWPTTVFMKNQQISCNFNCCNMKAEEAETLKVKEILFDVANWKYALIEELTLQNKKNKNDIKVNKSKNFKLLDFCIDEMHKCMISEDKNACLVHCHAGMHRSPFIIGCYLVKFGGFRDEAVENIYSFMKSKRKIVQEFGYDKTLMRYQQYLDTRDQQQGCTCFIL